MTVNEEVTPSQAETALIIANAGELAAAIFKRVAGNDISTAINGQTLTRDMVANVAATSFRRKLEALA